MFTSAKLCPYLLMQLQILEQLRLVRLNRIIDYLIDKYHKTIIVTDLLIIDHFISVSVTLAYLPLVFKHIYSLP